MSINRSTTASAFFFLALIEVAIIASPATSVADHNLIGLDETSRGVVKIGAIYSLEGPQSPLDRPSARGAMLAAREINAQGRMDGRRIELVLCDAKSDPARVRECAESLLRENVSAMMGLSDTDMVLAAAPLAEEAGIPFVTSGATSPRLAEVYKVLFLACFGDNVQAEAGALYAYDEMGLKTCSLLVDGDMEYARLLADYFKGQYQDLGGEIVLEAFINGSDPLNISRAIIDADADMIYLAAGPDESEDLIESMRREGIDRPVFGGDSFDSPQLRREGMGSIVFSTHALLDENSSVTGEFARAYRAEYGIARENAFSALGYDTVKLLSGAINRSGSTDPAAILLALENTSGFKGVTGEISYLDHGRIPHKDVTIILLYDQEITASEILAPSKPAVSTGSVIKEAGR